MKFAYIFLFLFSIVFIWVGTYLSRDPYILVSKGEKTIWTVVDHISSYDSNNRRTTYAPVMQYTCNGLEELNPSNLYSSSKYDIWTKLDIYCDPTKPNRFIIDSFMNKYFGLFFLISGFMSFIAAIWILVYSIKRMKLIEYLKSNGSRITAEVTFVWQNTSYSRNGKNPFYIKAIYQDGTNMIRFESDYLWTDIRKQIKVWDPITVYIFSDLNGIDYRKYWIDTRFLMNSDNI